MTTPIGDSDGVATNQLAATADWLQVVPCDNSGPNCPEIATTDDGDVLLRDSARPDEVVRFTPQAWENLRRQLTSTV